MRKDVCTYANIRTHIDKVHSDDVNVNTHTHAGLILTTKCIRTHLRGSN